MWHYFIKGPWTFWLWRHWKQCYLLLDDAVAGELEWHISLLQGLLEHHCTTRGGLYLKNHATGPRYTVFWTYFVHKFGPETYGCFSEKKQAQFFPQFFSVGSNNLCWFDCFGKNSTPEMDAWSQDSSCVTPFWSRVSFTKGHKVSSENVEESLQVKHQECISIFYLAKFVLSVI